MKHLSKALFTTLTLAALATPALAQDAPEGEAPAEGEAAPAEGEAAPAEAAPAEAAPAEGGMAQDIGPYTKEGYPTALIHRPLTLPKGMIEVRPSIDHVRLSISDGMGNSISGDATGLGVSVGYGISDKLEVGLGTGLGLDPDVEWSESIGLYGSFSVQDTAKMDLAPGVSTTLDFAEGADVLNLISIHGGFRYLLSDKLFVRAGQNLLDLYVAPEAGLRLNIQGGVGFQVNDNLAVALDLYMISLKVFGELGDSTFFDPFGLRLTGLYAISNKLDVFAGITFPSLADAGDLLAISVGANIRL